MAYNLEGGCLMTSNNGYDKEEKPMIPFGEFLQDVAQIDNKREFIRLVNNMIDTEIKYLPDPMKSIALKTIEEFKENYDDWKDYKHYQFTKTGLKKLLFYVAFNVEDNEWLPPTPPRKKRRGRRG